jgi:type III secretion protein Q
METLARTTPQDMLTITREDVLELGAAPTLPRAETALVRAINGLYGRTTALPLMLRGQPWQLRWCYPIRDVWSIGLGSRVSYRFRIGSHTGWLALDVPLLAALLGERRIDLLPRDLCYVLLADALHPVADALEKAFHLRFEWAPPESSAATAPAGAELIERAACFTLASADGTHGGHLLFDDDQAFAALLAAAPRPAAMGRASTSLDWLRIPLPFVVGRSHISLREIGSVRPGDIISIEHWGSVGTALTVIAELGGSAGRCLVGLAEGSRITLQQSKETAMNRDTPEAGLTGQDDAAASLPLDRLDALEVTLRFEVGELSVSLGELKGLNPGHVFELGHALNRSPVRIIAHGNVLGKGYLVAVGDQLGVRVSEFAPSEL